MKPKRSFPRRSNHPVPAKKKKLSENLWAFDADAAATFVDYDDLYSPVLNDMKLNKSPASLCTKIDETSCSWEIVKLFVGRRVFEEIKSSAFGLRLNKMAIELQHQHKSNFKIVCTDIRKKFPKYRDTAVDISVFGITQSQIEQSLYQIFGDLLQPVWGSFTTKKDTKIIVQHFADSMVHWCDGDVFMKDHYYEDVPVIWDQFAKVAMDTHLDEELDNYSVLASAAAINITRFVVLYSLHMLRKLTSLVFASGNSFFIEKSASKLAKESGKFANMFHNTLNVKREVSTAHSEAVCRAPVSDERTASDLRKQRLMAGETSQSTSKPAVVKVTQRVVTRVIDEVSISSDDEVSSPKIGQTMNKSPELKKSFDALKVKEEAIGVNNETKLTGFNSALNVKPEYIPSPSLTKSDAQNPDTASTASGPEIMALYPEFTTLDLDVMDEEMRKQILTDTTIPATTKGLIILLMDQKKDLKSRYNQLLDRMHRRTKYIHLATTNFRLYSQKVVGEAAAAASTVTRPPYYRKPHQHHTPKHMLQEEFMNAGDASGSGVRLFDYYKTAEMVNQLPTIKDKIDFVNPYERPWTRAERTWRRDWHPSLMATRKAWAIPSSPAYFDCSKFYQYITKTRLVPGSLDKFYESLVPPTDSFEKAMTESLSYILMSERFDSEEERVSAIIQSLFDEAMYAMAHNVTRLSDYRVAHDVQNESFWVRSGFMFLYDETEIVSKETVKQLNKTPKYIGDDRRKLGELAFVSRDKLAVQIRSREAPSPLFSYQSEQSEAPVFPEDVNIEEILYAPKVYNLWPDEEPLWQCPGFFPEADETHVYGRVAAKSLFSLDERCKYWGLSEDSEEMRETWKESAEAQAVASLFTTLCGQAHLQGFTQYTDVTRPITSQLVLSNGRDFLFAVGQLNTLAINIECDGFNNPKTNSVYVEGPVKLFDACIDGKFYHQNSEGQMEEGLNSVVLTRIMQMIMRD